MGFLNLFRSLVTVLVRLTIVIFFIVSCMSIPHSRRIAHEEGFDVDVDTKIIYIPLEICEKRALSFHGQAIILGKGDTCFTLTYLVTACTLSFAFAMVAALFWLFFDILAGSEISTISPLAIRGMSLFLVFSLFQSCACAWSLAQQVDYWVNYYTDIFDEYGNPAIETVKAHGNPLYFWMLGGFGVGSGALLLLELFLSLLSDYLEKKEKRKEGEAAKKAKEDASKSKAQKDVPEKAQPESETPKTEKAADATNSPPEQASSGTPHIEGAPNDNSKV